MRIIRDPRKGNSKFKDCPECPGILLQLRVFGQQDTRLMGNEMKVKIAGDAYIETGVTEVVIAISESGEDYFRETDYGNDLIYLGVVIICIPEDLNPHQRIVRSNKKSSLFIDVILNYQMLCEATVEARTCLVAKSLEYEVARILELRTFKTFKTEKFIEDWRNWIATWRNGFQS